MKQGRLDIINNRMNDGMYDKYCQECWHGYVTQFSKHAMQERFQTHGTMTAKALVHLIHQLRRDLKLPRLRTRLENYGRAKMRRRFQPSGKMTGFSKRQVVILTSLAYAFGVVWYLVIQPARGIRSFWQAYVFP